LTVVLVGALQAPSAYSDEVNVPEKSFVESLCESALAAGAPLVNTILVTVVGAAIAGVFYGMHIQKQRIYAAHTGLLSQGHLNMRFGDLPGATEEAKLDYLRQTVQRISDAAGYERYKQELLEKMASGAVKLVYSQ